jgi:DNA gyrase subunit A
MIERMAELVQEKKIEGISDLRDESDKSGVRVVIEVKKDAVPDVVLNQLYSYTPLQTSFGVNMLALDNGRPELMNLKHVITSFVRFREEVITRRTLFKLNKARDRAHVLVGLAIAVANIDEVIAVIKASADPNIAREELMKRKWPAEDVLSLLQLVDDSGNVVRDGKITFSEAQARAILELKLSRLTGLERTKIDEEMKELATEITEYLSILSNREKLYGILRTELLDAKEKFATPRRTIIEMSEFEADIEDLIQREDMVVTVTANGYIKRTPLSTYRAQRRGGKGRSGMDVRDEDITSELLVVNTHTPVLFFSNKGQVYKLKVYKLPIGAANTRGKALVNIFPLSEGETITTFMPLPEDETKWDAMNIFFATAKGNARRNDLSDFHDIRTSGKIAIRLDEADKLVSVRVCNENDHVLLAAKGGKCIRFPVNDVRVFKSRTSDGVRGMKLAEGDEVVSMTILHGIDGTAEERHAYLKKASAQRRVEGEQIDQPENGNGDEQVQEIALSTERFAQMATAEEFILTVTENGYGKRSSAYEYRTTGRGGSGIVGIITSERNGKVVASQPVAPTGEIMLMTNKATVIRCPIHDIRIAGRNTQGVTILKTGAGEKVVSVVCVPEGGAIDANGESGDDNTDAPLPPVAASQE